ELQAGAAAGVRVAVDEVAMREDDQDAPFSLLACTFLADHDVVEHGLGDRDRQYFLSAEANRVRELLRILHRRNLQDANADAVRGNAEAHAASRELVLRKEP